MISAELKNFWENHGKPTVDKVLNFVGKLVDGILELYNNAFVPLCNYIADKFSPILMWLAEGVIAQLKAKWIIVVDAIGDFMDALSTLIREIIAKKMKIEMQWNYLTRAQFAQLRAYVS